METQDTCFCEESFIDRSFLVFEILREPHVNKVNFMSVLLIAGETVEKITGLISFPLQLSGKLIRSNEFLSGPEIQPR